MLAPKVRKDGRCLVCKKERKMPKGHPYAQAMASVDPFCSSTCAKSWYGTDRVLKPGQKARAA